MPGVREPRRQPERSEHDHTSNGERLPCAKAERAATWLPPAKNQDRPARERVDECFEGRAHSYEQQPLVGREHRGCHCHGCRAEHHNRKPWHCTKVEACERARKGVLARRRVDEARCSEEPAVESVDSREHRGREHPQLAQGAKGGLAEQELRVSAAVEPVERHGVAHGERHESSHHEKDARSDEQRPRRHRRRSDLLGSGGHPLEGRVEEDAERDRLDRPVWPVLEDRERRAERARHVEDRDEGEGDRGAEDRVRHQILHPAGKPHPEEVRRHGHAYQQHDPDVGEHGGLVEAVLDRSADDECVRCYHQHDRRHVGERDRQSALRAHGSRHVEPDAGRARIEPVQLGEDPGHEEREEARDEYGEPRGVTGGVSRHGDDREVVHRGKGQSSRGGRRGCEPKRAP